MRNQWRAALRLLLSGLMTVAVLSGSSALANTCQLHSASGKITHVIYIQFDNTHFLRDNPHVPSDLEQMPHLLNFINDNGTLLTNDHTILISHTAGGILSSLTGVYPDRHGQTVSNSYVRTSSTGGFSFPSSFGYWTDVVSATNTPTVPNMVTPSGDNAPAPWVPYTGAGCDVGAIATANIVLENTGTGPNGDITKVFGNPSPQFTEAVASNAAQAGTAARAKAQTDFVGLAIHCAQGSPICANGQSDVLPQEPGGYAGFKALFGAQSVNPLLTGQAATVALTDLLGNAIVDPFNQPGFPGFDGMSAAVSLAYVAAMQEHGIPVTYAYISDAHDKHPSGPAFGPGEAGYVAALKHYDEAFGKFFDRLEKAGIDKSNTLFVITADEGDHFVGGPPSPANCDGVTIPCTYAQIGELNGNLAGLLATEQGITTPFTVHSDSAPTIYITGNPARDPSVTRTFGRALAQLTAVNPITGHTDPLAVALADPVGMKLLHRITADPARTPTLTMFADPNYVLFAGAPNCNNPCVTQQPGFAWNHGDISEDIARTWLGLVGPGVKRGGLNDHLWSDHTDIRPTMLTLLGLKDDYVHDGRVLVEVLQGSVLPQSHSA